MRDGAAVSQRRALGGIETRVELPVGLREAL
jgi:hypothetical protein